MKLLRRMGRAISSRTERGQLDIEDVYLIDPQGPSIKVKFFEKTFTLEPESSIDEFKKELTRAFGYRNVEVSDINLVKFHEMSRMREVALNDFIVTFNNFSHVAYISKFVDFDTFFTGPQKAEDPNIKKLVFESNKGLLGKFIKRDFASFVAQELQSTDDEATRLKMFRNSIEEKVYRDALFFEKKRRFYDKVSSILWRKIEVSRAFEKEELQRLDKKSRVPLNVLTFFLLGQIAFTQYGTYIGYSWDIMEPIVCFFSSVDIFCAYCYWYFFGEQFDYESYFQKRRKQMMASSQAFRLIQENKYEESMNYVQFKKSLLSDDSLSILNCLAKEVEEFQEKDEEDLG